MKRSGWLALAVGAGLGVTVGCFTAPGLTGPYLCDQQGQCSDLELSCVDGVCCKYDGGEPACSSVNPPPDGGPSDGGDDGGDNGGSRDGGDAGDSGTGPSCVVPTPNTCTVAGMDGSCAFGRLSCFDGGLRCDGISGPVPDVCNGFDDDCNGKVDDYPCTGGPTSFISPNPDFVLHAYRANGTATSLPQGCLGSAQGQNPEPWTWDAGNWKGVGNAAHYLTMSKADGGTWNLSAANEALLLAFDGNLFNYQAVQPFSWPQPLVMVCSTFGWRRYHPASANLIGFDGGSFSMSTGVNLASWLPDWFVDSPNGTGGVFDLSAVHTVQIILEPTSPTTGVVSFDAGFSRFGFLNP